MVETGRPFATSQEIAAEIGCDPSQVSNRMQRPRERGEVINVAPGGWVLGGMHTEPDDFLDDWMRYLNVGYHLAFSTASRAYVGAYQVLCSYLWVAVERPVRSRWLNVAGGTFSSSEQPNIRFVHRTDFDRYPTVTLSQRADRRASGHRQVRATTPEATVLDCVLRPQYAAGWYGVEDILARWLEFEDVPDAPRLDPDALAVTAERYPVRVRQQTGHLLSSLMCLEDLEGVEFDLTPLRSTLPSKMSTVTCGPLLGNDEQRVHDKVWRVLRDHTLEPDL